VYESSVQSQNVDKLVIDLLICDDPEIKEEREKLEKTGEKV